MGCEWPFCATVFFCLAIGHCLMVFVVPSSSPHELLAFIVLATLWASESAICVCAALDVIEIDKRNLFRAGLVLSLASAVAAIAVAWTLLSLALLVALLVAWMIHSVWALCVYVAELRVRAAVQPNDFCPPTEISTNNGDEL